MTENDGVRLQRAEAVGVDEHFLADEGVGRGRHAQQRLYAAILQIVAQGRLERYLALGRKGRVCHNRRHAQQRPVMSESVGEVDEVPALRRRARHHQHVRPPVFGVGLVAEF